MSEGPPTVHEPASPVTPPSPPPGPRDLPPWLDKLLFDSTPRGIIIALLAPIGSFAVAASCLVMPVVGQLLCMTFGMATGLAQLAWIIPLDRWTKHRGRLALRKGLWIGAAVVFLINGSCWGAVGMSALSSFR